MAKSDSKLKAAPRDAGKAKTKKTKKDKDMPKGQKKGKSASEKPQTSSGNELSLADVLALGGTQVCAWPLTRHVLRCN